jgi:hypothetical protein
MKKISLNFMGIAPIIYLGSIILLSLDTRDITGRQTVRVGPQDVNERFLLSQIEEGKYFNLGAFLDENYILLSPKPR